MNIVDSVLERWDLTDTAMQRKIVFALVERYAKAQDEIARLTAALHANRCHPDWTYMIQLTHSELSKQWRREAGLEPNHEYQTPPGDESWRRRKEPS